MIKTDREDKVDLDPSDWHAFRKSSHQALDSMIDFLESIRERPVWTAPPESVRQAFQTPLPLEEREFQAWWKTQEELVQS